MPDLTSLRFTHPRSTRENLVTLALQCGGATTQVFNMDNRENIIVSIQRTNTICCLVVDCCKTQDFTSPENGIDGMQEILTGEKASSTIANFFAHYDFGSCASRAIYWDVGQSNGAGATSTTRWDLDTSVNGTCWTERDTWTRTGMCQAITFPTAFEGRDVSAVAFRYVRLDFHMLSNQGVGRGKISQLSTTSHFSDPTPTLGAIVNVRAKLEHLICEGTRWKDVTTFSTTKYGQEEVDFYSIPTVILPNDATHLRLNLNVCPSDAKIETGVEVLKV